MPLPPLPLAAFSFLNQFCRGARTSATMEGESFETSQTCSPGSSPSPTALYTPPHVPGHHSTTTTTATCTSSTAITMPMLP